MDYDIKQLKSQQEKLATLIVKRYKNKGFKAGLERLNYAPLFERALAEEGYLISVQETGLSVAIQNCIAISVPLIWDTSGRFVDGKTLPEDIKEKLTLSSRILVSYGPQVHHLSEKLSIQLNTSELLDLYCNKERLLDRANKKLDSLIGEYSFLKKISDGYYSDKNVKDAFVINSDALAKL